jgi:hypothetical protein
MYPSRISSFLFLFLWSAITVMSSAAAFDCIDLTPYADDEDKLANLMGGGIIDNDQDVIFEIDGGFAVNGETVFCLENIKIPDQVGDNVCSPSGSSGNCQLVVGVKSMASSSEKKYCDESFGNDASCYECTCNGAKMNNGTASEATSGGCGLSDINSWGNSCHDVTNGRISGYDFDDSGDMTRLYSDYAVAHVSICPDSFNRCGFCQGAGTMPSFKVRKIQEAVLQWKLRMNHQCTD